MRPRLDIIVVPTDTATFVSSGVLTRLKDRIPATSRMNKSELAYHGRSNRAEGSIAQNSRIPPIQTMYIVSCTMCAIYIRPMIYHETLQVVSQRKSHAYGPWQAAATI